MTIKELEPFAHGFINAGRDSREYRIANGIKTFAEYVPVEIVPSEWFPAPIDRMYDQMVRYCRASGLSYDENKHREREKQYPELEDEFDKLSEYFRAIDTVRITAKQRTPLQEKLEINKCCWATGGGHSNPDYEMLLRIGTNGIREKISKFRFIHNDRDDLYDSFLLTTEALEIIADRYRAKATEMLETAQGEDAVALKRIADGFSNVPRNTPRNFFEACLMFWLSFAFVDIDSPGLFDYSLGVYYQNDDKEDRYECLRKLWDRFRITRTWNLCVGGSDEYGNDRTCDLSYDVLRIAREYLYDTPNITMRVHPGTPEKLWQEALDTLATGIGMPAIYNDECVCPALEALGIPASDSHLYCMNGCNQIDIFGKSHMGLEDGEVSIAKALEFALNNGVCRYTDEKLGVETGDARKFETFDELMKAYYTQVEYMADYVTEMSNKAQRIFAEEAPNPWKSIIIQGCIEKGLDYKNRGPIYGHGQILTEGLPDAADSLAAIKHFVFDEKKYTMTQLIDALDADFEGFDELYEDFSGYHKFGNDIDDVDEINATITDHFYRYCLGKKTFRGGNFGVGCSTFNRAANYGRHLGALPNGKKKFAPLLAESIGPTPGNDTNGPTAMLNSVLKCNQFLATSGNVLQMKFSKSQFATPSGKAAFEALAKTYFRLGGQTLQINVVSREDLLAAQVHPEDYKNLIVRVGGFSAYFVNLSKGLQDNIIARTEQEM